MGKPQLVPSLGMEPATGPTAAAILAAAIGCFTMGVLTTAAGLSKAINSALAFYPAAGALSGEGTISVALWLLCWIALARMWRYSSPRLGRVLGTAYALLFLGLLLSFPPFLHLLAGR